jgi:hypothetical protein
MVIAYPPMSGYNRTDALSPKKSYWPMVLVLLAVLYFVNVEVFIAGASIAAIVFAVWFFLRRGRR